MKIAIRDEEQSLTKGWRNWYEDKGENTQVKPVVKISETTRIVVNVQAGEHLLLDWLGI